MKTVEASKPYRISDSRQVYIAPIAFTNFGWIAGKTELIQILDLENRRLILQPVGSGGQGDKSDAE